MLIAAAATTTPALAGEFDVTLTPHADGSLYEDSTGSLANGAGSHLFTGVTVNGALRRGLIAFDLASIPAGSTITGATLTLHMSRTAASSELVRLHRATTAWGEGASDASGEEGGGAATAPGDATWIHAFSPGSFWTTPGGDYEAEFSAETVVVGNGFYSWSSAAMIADAQLWLDQPDLNAGWFILTPEELAGVAKRFDSREHPDAKLRPSLRVSYIPTPGAGGVIAAAAWAVATRRRPRRAVPEFGTTRIADDLVAAEDADTRAGK